MQITANITETPFADTCRFTKFPRASTQASANSYEVFTWDRGPFLESPETFSGPKSH